MRPLMWICFIVKNVMVGNIAIPIKLSQSITNFCATACGTIKPCLCRTSLLKIRRMNFRSLRVLLLAVFYNQQIILRVAIDISKI